MSDIPAQECPKSLRQAFLDLLSLTLLTIRANAGNRDLCFALSDHMHNVPRLLAHFLPSLLAFYWDVERPCFLRALEAMGQPPPAYFEEPWGIIEFHYQRLCKPPTT